MAHDQYAGPDAAAFGTSVAEDGTFERVHDEPDIPLYSADFYVCFVSRHGKVIWILFVRISIYEGLYT